MNEVGLLQAVTEVGDPAALVVLFVFWSWKREEKLTSRVTESENYIRQELLNMIQRTVHAMEDNTVAYRQVIELVGDLSKTVTVLAEARPCKYDEMLGEQESKK